MAYFGLPVTIQPKAAKLTHDTAILRMDPYCVVWLGNQSARTTTNFEGGRHPHWNDVLTLFRNQEDNIRFLIYDRDSVEADAFVAEGHFHFNTYQGGIFEEWIPLHYRGRSAGELHVNIQIQPGGAQGYPQAYPQQGYIPGGQGGHQQPVREVIIEEGRHHHHGERVEEVIYTQQPGGYPQPGYQQPVREVIIEEGRHHHGGRVEEVIYTQQPGGYPQPGYQQPQVIIEEEARRHHHGHPGFVEEKIIVNQPQYPGQPLPQYPGQPYPGQPYPGQQPYGQYPPGQPGYPPY